MTWIIIFNNKAKKQMKDLKNKKLHTVLRLLVEDLKNNGPCPGKQWPNYGKLRGFKGDHRHCHLIKGNPTYVCCWEVVDLHERKIEVNYVGTHEKAPY